MGRAERVGGPPSQRETGAANQTQTEVRGPLPTLKGRPISDSAGNKIEGSVGSPECRVGDKNRSSVGKAVPTAKRGPDLVQPSTKGPANAIGVGPDPEKRPGQAVFGEDYNV